MQVFDLIYFSLFDGDPSPLEVQNADVVIILINFFAFLWYFIATRTVTIPEGTWCSFVILNFRLSTKLGPEHHPIEGMIYQHTLSKLEFVEVHRPHRAKGSPTQFSLPIPKQAECRKNAMLNCANII
jgi:hypothetical protein